MMRIVVLVFSIQAATWLLAFLMPGEAEATILAGVDEASGVGYQDVRLVFTAETSTRIGADTMPYLSGACFQSVNPGHTDTLRVSTQQREEIRTWHCAIQRSASPFCGSSSLFPQVPQLPFGCYASAHCPLLLCRGLRRIGEPGFADTRIAEGLSRGGPARRGGGGRGG